MLHKEYVILDIETAGLDPKRSGIIEVGALKIRNNQTQEEFQSFVKTDAPLSLFIKRLTGIKDADVKDAPPISEVIARLQRFIGNSPVVAHNGFSFDFQFLSENGLILKEKYDSLEFAFFVLPVSPEGHSIKALLRRFELGQESHRALDDCHSSFRVIRKLQETFQSKPKKKREALKHAANQIGWWWTDFLRSSSNSINSVADIVEEFVPYRKPHSNEQVLEMQTKLQLAEVESFFNSDKLIGTEYSEDRPEQKKMAKAVAKGFNEESHLVIEAGTGTGKSKAYLVPAALYALKNGIPVIVSTHTKVLQDQLFQKEVAHLREVVNPDLRVTILKGKQNYVCLKKLQRLIDSTGNLKIEPDYIITERRIKFSRRLAAVLLMAWASATDRGDWDEIPYWLKESLDPDIENEICNKDELCVSDSCELYDQNKCFLAKARKRAKDADVVIVNHAVALSGIKMEGSTDTLPTEESSEPQEAPLAYSHTVFPGEAKYIVFDEAHHLERDATSAWQHEVSKYQLDFFKDQVFGSSGVQNILKPKANDVNSPLESLHQRLMAHEGRIMAINESLFVKSFPALMQRLCNEKDSDLLIDDLLESSSDFQGTFATLRELKTIVSDTYSLLKRGEDLVASPRLRKIVSVRTEHAKRLLKSLVTIIDNDPAYVRYLQRQGQMVGLIAAPLSVAEHLNELVYKNFKSVVMTSATLTTKGSFGFITNRLGLNLIPRGKIFSLQAPSSFDYASQVGFYVPENIRYKDRREQHFQESIAFLERAVLASAGGALILCSSHEQVDAVYHALNKKLSDQNILLLRQERERSVYSIVADFKDDINSVLIGTELLWEGIDVPGDALRTLFILKIPFPPPRALLRAREADIERKGGNGYLELREPMATIALKQGFGRLIRKKTDKGIAVLFDAGVFDKQNIVISFPQGVTPQKASEDFILAEIEKLATKVAANHFQSQQGTD